MSQDRGARTQPVFRFSCSGVKCVASGVTSVQIKGGSARSRGAARLGVVLATAALALLALTSAALATDTRNLQSSFATGFSDPQAIAVDQASGDVYVVNPNVPEAGTVSRFTATGAPDDFTAGPNASSNTLTGFPLHFQLDSPSAAQVAIDNSGGPTNGDIYVTNSIGGLDIEIYANTGAYLGKIDKAGSLNFTEPCGVAVDPAGRLYVGDFGGVIDRFTPSANPPTNADLDGQITRVSNPCNIAADSSGAVYVSTWSNGPLVKYAAADFGASAPSPVVVDAASNAVAVDPSNDDVYVDEGDRVSVFDSTGAVLYTFGSSADFGTDSRGVAVAGSGGNAYVADHGSGEVDVFGPAVALPPSAVTDPATNVHHTSAVLHGHLDPSADPGVTGCHFEWGLDTSYGNTVPCNEGNSFTAPADVTANLGGLTPGQTVHFRLDISTTSNGDFRGSDQSFTPSAFPVVHDEITAFGSDGSLAGSFGSESPNQLAFDQASEKLFALDRGAPGIDGFDASAAPNYSPLLGFAPLATEELGGAPALAVDNSALSSNGNLYLVSEGTQLVYGFDAAGAPLGGNFPIDPSIAPGAPNGSPTDICGAAVDSAGKLWVTDFATDTVLEYNAAGVFQKAVSTAGNGGSPCQIAFDSSDNLYVAGFSQEDGGTFEYSVASGYTTATQVDPRGAVAIAVDPSTGNLYVAHNESVDEYDSTGMLLSEFATGIAGASFHGVTVDAANHDIYISDTGNHKIRVFSPPIAQKSPTITPGDPTALTGSSVVLHADVDPEGIAITDCHFDYGSTAAYGQTVPCTPAPGSGSGDVAVSASLSGLAPGATYHFRIVAANANGASASEDQSFTTLGPRVHDTGAIDITTVDARLEARVNPANAPTTYHFDYGTTASYGQSTPESGSIGSDDSDHAASQTIDSLTPGTTYHFRIVATNADATTRGPDVTFTTYGQASDFASCPDDALRSGPGARLPDCRAYEQASPVNKNGVDVTGGSDRVQAATAGDAVTFLTLYGLPGAVGAQDFPSFLAHRGDSNWSTQGLFPPSSYGPNAAVTGWTPDLAETFISSLVTFQEGPEFLARDNFDGSFTTIVPHTVGGNVLGVFAGASEDGSRVFFQSSTQLSPDAAPGRDNLYVWNRAGNTTEPAGVLPDGACGATPCAPSGGSFAGPFDWFAPSGTTPNTLRDGGIETGNYTQDIHAISTDGATAFFTAGDTGQVYVRQGLAGPAPSTVQISASQAATPDPNGPKPAIFVRATPSGSKAFFTTCEKLTDDATAVSTSADRCDTAEQGQDLYAYDTAGGQLSDLTVDHADPHGADVKGILGASDDGAYVYFAANGVLAPGATLGNCEHEEGAYRGTCNLYLAHAGTTAFVARLNSSSRGDSDAADWAPSGPPHKALSVVAVPATARVSPDGHTLLFRSRLRLTAYDNSYGCEDDGRCAEFYRYNTADGLACISCNPTGARPTGEASLQSIAPPGGFETNNLGALLTRNLSTGGDRVFFESPDQLVAADTNNVRDVYEWEAAGAGSCQGSEAGGGCLYLLSTGTGADPAFFGDASASGDDVFIFTRDPLVPQDQDTLQDVYDVRVDGGLASQHATPPVGCAGEACQGQAASAPSFSPPGSSSAGSSEAAPPASAPAPKPKSLTNARRLAKALKACHGKHNRRKRGACEAQARKRYGPKHPPARAKSHKGGK